VEEKELQILNKVEKDLQVKGDPDAVRIVLRNLLGNAIKFVHPKTGRIELISTRLEGGKVKIAVRDNGIGMNGSQINRLLQNQNSVSKPGTSGEKGTALGIPLCQELLLNMDSSLQIDSAVDQGSEFYFILSEAT